MSIGSPMCACIRLAGAIACILILWPGRVPAAQETMPSAGAMHRLQVEWGRVPIARDGRLDAAYWDAADSITYFRQRDPVVGAPASERTVVKVMQDRDALHVAVQASDDSAGIRASLLRR